MVLIHKISQKLIGPSGYKNQNKWERVKQFLENKIHLNYSLDFCVLMTIYLNNIWTFKLLRH